MIGNVIVFGTPVYCEWDLFLSSHSAYNIITFFKISPIINASNF